MALERGRRAFPLISPGSAIVLWQEGDHLLVGRETGLNGVIGRRHLEDAALLIIQQVVRHYLGPHWQPAWVEIPGGERVRERFIEDAIGARVRTGRKMPAVAIPRCELSRTNPKLPSASDTLTFNDLPVLMGVSPPGSNVDAAFEVLRTQLGAEDLSEDGVARQLSMGPRTLQRLLKAEGTTFREVKARFLQDRALELLAESDLSVEAISAFLGYTEPNSFRRAFKAWTGISPTEFRAGCRGTLR
jgi:AraC-like DNA-binding protein